MPQGGRDTLAVIQTVMEEVVRPERLSNDRVDEACERLHRVRVPAPCGLQMGYAENLAYFRDLLLRADRGGERFR